MLGIRVVSGSVDGEFRFYGVYGSILHHSYSRRVLESIVIVFSSS